MTEADYVWLTNPNLPDNPVIRIADGSQWHYAQGGWVETDPVPDLTAADIEAQAAAEDVEAEAEAEATEDQNNLAAELAQEPDPETPAQEES